MAAALDVKNLCKEYESFTLDRVSFSVEPGTVMGFIGRNGAGKTTTLKSILDLVHPSAGEVSFFGLPMGEHEAEIKQRIGYAGGTVSWYRKKKLRDIVRVTASFYDSWDRNAWTKYSTLFRLDEAKTPEQLSEGMKVKLNIALALSHRAELLILDEPTSGLDPVSRDELLEIFMRLAKSGVAVLFSTHITSDLEKCADYITYIQKGRIFDSCSQDDFVGKYRLIHAPGALGDEQKKVILGGSISRTGQTALIRTEDAPVFEGYALSCPTLEEIMIMLEKEDAE